MNEPNLYVVTTDFDGWQQTRSCLQNLESSTYTDFATIVVDHGTTDETATGLKAFPACVHLRGAPELWWAGATNLGIRAALDRGASHIMLLNNDCYVDALTLTEVMSKFSEVRMKVVAPVQRDLKSGAVLVARASTCFTLGFPSLMLPNMRSLPATDDSLLPTGLIVGGRGAVIPASVFELVGLFDEKALPHYGADHDFYLRCRAKGVPLYLATRANVSIDGTRTTVATGLGDMTWPQFKASLRDRRSHRNIDALRTLFRRYYPVKLLYPLGLSLNLGRYFTSYIVQRLVSWFGRG